MIYILRSNGPLLIQGNFEMIANHVNKNIFVLSFENTTNKGQEGNHFYLNVCYYWSLNSPLLLTFSKNRRILTGWSKAHLLILHLLCFFLRVAFPTFFAAPAAASAGRRGGESGGQQRQQHCTGSVPFRADRCTGRAYSTLHVAHCTLGFAQCVH